MRSANHVMAGAVPALFALIEGPHTPESLRSLQRIGERVQAVSGEMDDPELTRIAREFASVDDWAVALRLTTELAEALQKQNTKAVTTILIIEDDKLTARVLNDELQGSGREVIIANRAADAERLLRDRDVSLVLLDLLLPDGDGRDLLLRIRLTAGTRAVPILVITGRQDIATQTECYALGADGLIVKPAQPAIVRAAVSALLNHAEEHRLEGRSDRLTGLANRVAFMESLQRAAPLVRRRGLPLSVAMIDLDHFKSVNDRYGHSVGDEVLRRTAQCIATTLRVSDVIARWGGEEFCVFFPDTGADGAITALGKAAEAVRELQFETPQGSFGVTFSAGVAIVKDPASIDAAIADADHLLYLAKAAGRNRALSADDAVNPPRPVILLVEDDTAVARMVTTLLNREGYDVLYFSEGNDALAGIGEQDFVLALLDVNLPGVSGFDLLEAIRTRRHLSKIPVIMLTGSDDEQDVVRGFSLGVNDYVTKPFYPAELVARIERLLTR